VHDGGPTDPTPSQIQEWYIANELFKDKKRRAEELVHEFRISAILEVWDRWTKCYVEGQREENQVGFRKMVKKWSRQYVTRVNSRDTPAEVKARCQDFEIEYGWDRIMVLYKRYHPEEPNEIPASSTPVEVDAVQTVDDQEDRQEEEEAGSIAWEERTRQALTEQEEEERQRRAYRPRDVPDRTIGGAIGRNFI
jgi:hypothetical protein